MPWISPSDAVAFAPMGSHVKVVFSDGVRTSGYLVSRDGYEFSLRGVGWSASHARTYRVIDVAEFTVSDPQPDYSNVRF